MGGVEGVETRCLGASPFRRHPLLGCLRSYEARVREQQAVLADLGTRVATLRQVRAAQRGGSVHVHDVCSPASLPSRPYPPACPIPIPPFPRNQERDRLAVASEGTAQLRFKERELLERREQLRTLLSARRGQLLAALGAEGGWPPGNGRRGAVGMHWWHIGCELSAPRLRGLTPTTCVQSSLPPRSCARE